MDNILLIGAGGHAKSCIDIIESSNEYYITAGTKNLIKEITVEEIDKPSDTRRLTHPDRKTEVMQERGLTQVIKPETSIDDFSDDVNSLI